MLKLYKPFISKRVRIRLHDNTVIEGYLISIDGYMNVSLQHVLYYACADSGSKPVVLSSVVIRGNNVECITL